MMGTTRLRFEDSPAETEEARRAHTRLPSPEPSFSPAHAVGDVDRLRRDYERLRVAFVVSRQIGVEQSLPALLDRVLTTAFDVFTADRGAIVLVDPDSGTPIHELARSRYGDEPEDDTVSTTLLDEVRAERAAILVADALSDEKYRRAASLHGSGIRSALYVPIVYDQLLLGVMHLDAFGREGAFTEQDRELGNIIAGQAALAIRAAMLRERLAQETERERMHREAELARLEHLIRDLPVGIVILDDQRRVQAVNRQAEAWLHVLTPAKKGDVLDELGACRIDQIPDSTRSGELEVVVSEPKRRTFSISASRTRPLDERAEAVIVIRETTAEREREQAAARGERMALVGQLAGGIAHDFNNLLSVILTYTEFLGAELKGTPLEEDLDIVKQAGQRAGALTRQLLAFSRREVVMPMVLDLNRVVGGLEMLLRRTIGEDIELRMELDPHVRAVKADPGRIEQVLMNLAVNARDAMGSGGTLIVRTAPVVFDTPLVPEIGEPLPEGVYAALSVTDTGHGMSAETARRIFEPFFTTKEVGKGTGLGLATVQAIVSQAGGGIRVESIVGEGTTFVVYLPATPEKPTTIERGSRPSPQTVVPGGRRVLVTEDEPAVRHATARILRDAGFEVFEAESGAEALRFAEERGSPDLLVTDVMMPRMSGPDLVMRMRERRPSLPVLFVSGCSDAAERCQVIAQGAPVLEKPFSQKELVERVRAMLLAPSADESTAVS
jgi:signal transduction histidine kinase/ActR/RegA family two-component response regulator